MISRYAVNVGINDYPGTNGDLSGCVNDANDWANFLEGRGYSTTRLLDSDATKVNVLEALTEVLAKADYRDRVVFTYSGHGTWTPDFNGDEVDGRDEALVMNDFSLILDDDLHQLYESRKWGVRLVTVSDSCHSGSVSRFLSTSGEGTTDATPRFLSPQYLNYTEEQLSEAARLPRKKMWKSVRASSGVLLSGCADEELSYDAWFNGRANGAMTYNALKKFRDGQTFRQWHDSIRNEEPVLPSAHHPQTPQLTGSWYQKNRWKAFD